MARGSWHRKNCAPTGVGTAASDWAAGMPSCLHMTLSDCSGRLSRPGSDEPAAASDLNPASQRLGSGLCFSTHRIRARWTWGSMLHNQIGQLASFIGNSA